MSARFTPALAVVCLLSCVVPSSAQTLVGDPFTSSYTGWIDAPLTPARTPLWRLSLHNPTLMDTNNANPPTAGAVNNSGVYESDVLVQDNFLAPGTYTYTARMRTSDDDILGIIWNYQDPGNYFRVGIRTQAAGSFGGTQGVSVQKFVNGVMTQISPAAVGPGLATPITQAMINNRTPFDLGVSVDGTNYQVLFNGSPLISGTDPDLAAARKIGVQSWAQLSDTDETPDPPFWGTEVDSVSVTQGASSLYTEAFDRRPIRWRQLVMTNATGTVNTGNTASKDDLGNFGRTLSRPWIHQQSNGFENATVNNTDFIGPAVVVDEQGSTALSDYDMRIRIGATDNDGVGVLVRVQDDNNFYRINFTNEAIGAGVTRAPRGLSVQKVFNGVWTELFRDDQNAPLFVYTPGAAGTTPDTVGFPMFDLSVQAVGNTLDVTVTDHLGNVIDYPLIVDTVSPLLAGTVGLTTWGTENVYYTNYGGFPGPLVTTIIPEPAAVPAVLAFMACLARRRRPA